MNIIICVYQICILKAKIEVVLQETPFDGFASPPVLQPFEAQDRFIESTQSSVDGLLRKCVRIEVCQVSVSQTRDA